MIDTPTPRSQHATATGALHMDDNSTTSRGPRQLTRDDALFGSVLVLGFSFLTFIFIWGLHDAERDRRHQLNHDTRGPQTLPVTAGRVSLDSAEEFAAFYPARLKAHAGDTVRFTNPTLEDPHTVTFGLEPSRSNQPSFGDGKALPHVNGPCVSEVALTASTMHCTGSEARELPPYSGQAYFNSGIIAPGGGTFDLRLASDLASGTYSFFCVIHPGQAGTIDVVERDETTQRPQSLIADATKQFERDRTHLRQIQRQAGEGLFDAGSANVRAGAATERVSLNRFLPREVAIEEGASVTWTNTGSVPHVMTFGGVISPPDAIETPPTRASGSSITDGLFSTGPIGAWPYPRTEFTIRFDRRGRYEYACWLHPGMTGTVVVR